MLPQDDDRQEEHDWPDEHPPSAPAQPPEELPQSDEGYHPTPSQPRRRPQPRRGGGYRAHSELDDD